MRRSKYAEQLMKQGEDYWDGIRLIWEEYGSDAPPNGMVDWATVDDVYGLPLITNAECETRLGGIDLVGGALGLPAAPADVVDVYLADHREGIVGLPGAYNRFDDWEMRTSTDTTMWPGTSPLGCTVIVSIR